MRGQAAQASEPPSGPSTSGPPQEPRRQRPSSNTPIAMIAMTIAIPPNVNRNTAIGPIVTLQAAVLPQDRAAYGPGPRPASASRFENAGVARS